MGIFSLHYRSIDFHIGYGVAIVSCHGYGSTSGDHDDQLPFYKVDLFKRFHSMTVKNPLSNALSFGRDSPKTNK